MIVDVFGNESDNFKPIIEEFLYSIYNEKDNNYVINHDVLLIYGNNFECYEIQNDSDNKILFTKDYVRIIIYNNIGLDRIILIENSEIKGFELSDMI